MAQKIPFEKSKEINFFVLKSKQPKTPFAPNYQYIIGESFLNKIDVEKISKFILNEEDKIINNFKILDPSKINDGHTGLGDDSLTARYPFYNLFNFYDRESEFLKLKNEIKKKYNLFLKQLKLLDWVNKPAYIQCWANVMRNGEQIKPHLHSSGEYTYLSGHFCVQTQKTNTYYINPTNFINEPEIYESENVPGKLTFFQTCFPHYTDVYKGNEERITIAFDISIEDKSKNTSYIKF